MSLPWVNEVLAVLRKEAKVELRGKTGVATSGVFALSTVVTVSLALYNQDPNKRELQDVCSSLVWIIILFASLLTLPRTFLAEEEQRTADLLRLVARPHAIFWGKMIFNLIQMWALTALVTILFVVLTGLKIESYGLLISTLLTGSAAIVGSVTLCGAIASHATNRAALAGTIAIPLILFPSQWGVGGLRMAFGDPLAIGGTASAIGLFAYATLSIGFGPWIYAAIWKG